MFFDGTCRVEIIKRTRTIDGIGGIAGDIGVAGNGGAVPLQIIRVKCSRPNRRIKGWGAQAIQRGAAGDGSNSNGRSSYKRKDHGRQFAGGKPNGRVEPGFSNSAAVVIGGQG